jgi:hypothetical protein
VGLGIGGADRRFILRQRPAGTRASVTVLHGLSWLKNPVLPRALPRVVDSDIAQQLFTITAAA